MEGRVTVGNGNGQLETNGDGTLSDGSSVRNVTLTIEAGVNVYGKTGTFANLVITRGSNGRISTDSARLTTRALTVR